MTLKSFFLLTLLISGTVTWSYGQRSTKDQLVYVDNKGVMRYTKGGTEAAFFGVNYTVPFAYGYRSIKALNLDLKEEIDKDVYHFARLGIDAFRVHVWDVEISDSAGNLLQNEHLDLFDYLLAALKKRGIKTIITPIAYWGNGYPERDEPTPGFSSKWGRGRVNINDTAIRAQENYLQQFFKHVNRYTNTTYHDDQDVIAVEINNEPVHSGPKAGVTSYINRMVAAIKSTGYSKPIFYNISQNAGYADAVAAANVNGFTMQWYPTRLVANRELKGNFLPNVDRYTIPFDTIAAYRNKARMIYEFDAADILQSNMYPAMARSFKEAGFQWATQFAYDPLATAYGNTEYQTHYLNLAFTPAKAVSLLIASKVFHRIPRLKTFGVYPADSVFDVFRVSYRSNLSEMNSGDEFYYSNTTTTVPKSVTALQHLAGVGSSPVVQYDGNGAYFMDKLEEGIWRLEVMPDAIHIRDPFERASSKKVVTRIEWNRHAMEIDLPDLGEGFTLQPLNEGNHFTTSVTGNRFYIGPGTYLVTRKGKTAGRWNGAARTGNIGLNEFVAPKKQDAGPLSGDEPATSAVTEFSAENAVLLFNAATDKQLLTYSGSRRGNESRLVFTDRPGSFVYRMAVTKMSGNLVFGFQNYIGNRLSAHKFHNGALQSIVIRGRTANAQPLTAKLILITKDAIPFSVTISLPTSLQDVEIPLSRFQQDSMLLLPRPYPGFMPLWFSPMGRHSFSLADVEKLQIVHCADSLPFNISTPYSMEIESIRIKK